MKRPMAAVAAMIIIGIIAGQYIPLKVCTALVVLVLILSIVAKNKIKTYFVYALPISMLIGVLLIASRNVPVKEYLESSALRGVVFETSITKSGRQSLILKTEEVHNDGETYELNADIWVLLKEGVFVKEGDLLVIKGELEIPQSADNPGGFNSLAYMKGRGIEYTIFADEVIKYGEKHSLFKEKISGLRQRVNMVFDRALPDEEGSIAKAMVTGDTSFLEENTRELYSGAGIAHVLAVSGLHTTILAFMLLSLFNKGFRLNKRLSRFAVMALLMFYMIFVGNKTAAIRAVIMAEVLLLGGIIHRDGDTINSIGFAAVIILFINPYQLFNAGFLLSFITVTGLVLIAGNIEKGNTLAEKAGASFKTAFMVNIVSFPIVAWCFYEIPLLGCFVNLIAIPITGIAVGFGMAAGFIGLISAKAAVFLCGPVYIVLKIYNDLCSLAVSAPFHTLLVGRPSVLFCILYYLLLLMLLFINKKRTKFKFAFCLVLVSIFINITSNRIIFKNTTVDFLYVGQGDCVVINTYDNKTFIIDGGGVSSEKIGENTGTDIIIPFLESKGIGRVDGLFITHMDTDHALGAIELIRDYDVEKVYISDYDTEDGLINDVLESAKEKNIEVDRISAGGRMTINQNTNFTCLYPYGQKLIEDDNDNHGSLVIKLTCGEREFIFTGDAEEYDERLMLLGGQDVSADVLKAGHHGSSGSSSERFLEAVNCEYAVISCGRNNVYGHPHEETVERLVTSGAKIYNTSVQGNITFTTDGKNLWVKTQKRERK